MDRVIILIIFLLNFLKFIFIFFLYIRSKSFPSIYIRLILYFTAINVFLYGLLVNILRFISNCKVIKDYGVSTSELLYVELFEFISSFLFLSLLYIYFHSKFGKRLSKPIKDNGTAFPLLVFFNILSFLIYFVSDVNNEFLFGETIKYISGPSSLLLTFFSIKYKKYFLLLFSLPNLILIIFLVFSTGVRGPILGIILIFIYLLITNYSYKKVLRKIPFFVIPLFLIIIFNSEYSKIKYAFATEYISNPKAYQSIVDIGGFIIEFYKSGNNQLIEGSSSNISEEIEFRLGARSMYSAGFLRFVQNKGFVYEKPIINTLYLFFPRALFDQYKPYPDSYDGEIYGMGMYVCANEIDGQVNMTDFYSSSHYYWQFGFLGVIVFAFLSTLYIIFISIVTSKFGDIFKLFFFLVALKPYYFIPQFTISEIILMIFTKMLPLLILYKSMLFFKKKFNL